MNTFLKSTKKSICGLPFYTWSDQWAKKFSLLGEELSDLETTIINIDPDEPYGLTYNILDDLVISRQLHNAVDDLADMLIKLNPERGIMMFEKLMSEKFTSKSLHSLFSLLSKRINDKQGLAKSVSLHSPIKPEPYDKGFPIHADLFKARAILNIIFQTDQFDGGDILLISFEEFLDAMYEAHSMPASAIEFVKNMIRMRTPHDEFNSIFDLIHGDHPWVSNLKVAIESRQICIPCFYGIGYFIVDGQWLHGRTKIHGPVFETRLERLIFDTKYTISLEAMSVTTTLESYKNQVYAKNILLHKAQKSLLNKSPQQD